MQFHIFCKRPSLAPPVPALAKGPLVESGCTCGRSEGWVSSMRKSTLVKLISALRGSLISPVVRVTNLYQTNAPSPQRDYPYRMNSPRLVPNTPLRPRVVIGCHNNISSSGTTLSSSATLKSRLGRCVAGFSPPLFTLRQHYPPLEYEVHEFL